MDTNKTKEILKKVRQVEIRTNRLVNDALAGQYHSVFKGSGMNFDAVREYVRGDELKRIDWNVTARAGLPYVKEFTEERELTIMLLVDVSGSGEFGSAEQSKRELVAELASVLAFSATKNNDKVGLILFSDEVELYIPPRKGRSHVLRVIREILFFQPERTGTDIEHAMDFVSRVLSRKAVTFIISDFCFNGEQEAVLESFRKKLQITNKRHDAIAVAVNDPRELELPDIGYITIEDAETGEQVELNTSKRSVRDSYALLAEKQRTELKRAVKSAGVDMLEISTEQPYMVALQQFFSTRKGRR